MLAGILLWMLGYLAARAPAYRDDGWVKFVPATYLALAAPTNFLPPRYAGMFMGNTSPSGPMPIGEDLGRDVWDRLHNGTMWTWQERLFLRRCIEPARTRWESGVRVPFRWCRGETIPVDSRTPVPGTEWGLQLRDDKSSLLGEENGRARIRVCFYSGSREVYSTSMLTRCQLVQTPKEIVRADAGPRACDAAQRELNPRLLVLADGPVGVVVRQRSNSHPWEDSGIGLGCRVEILLDGTIIGRARYAPDWSRVMFKKWHQLAVVWEPEGAERVRANPDAVLLRVTGDVLESVCSLRRNPFDIADPRAWTGTFESPPKILWLLETYEPK